MMMIPVPVIAFFLATLLLPADVRQFTIDFQERSVRWTKQNAAWHAVELPGDDWGMFSVEDKVVTVAGEGKEWKTDVKQFLSFPERMDPQALLEIPTKQESYGTPVEIKREKTKIILSQKEGVLFKSPATITWKKPEHTAE